VRAFVDLAIQRLPRAPAHVPSGEELNLVGAAGGRRSVCHRDDAGILNAGIDCPEVQAWPHHSHTII